MFQYNQNGIKEKMNTISGGDDPQTRNFSVPYLKRSN